MEQTLIFIAILIFSIIIHEVAHGLTALYLGDNTAEQAGRLTLNPLPHLDIIGSIILPLFLVISGSPFLFGWAKPVPFNPYNLTDKKWGILKVAIAGPVINLILSLIAILGIHILSFFSLLNQNILEILQMIYFTNFFLAIFNLLPIFPLDGSKILFSFLSDYKWTNFKNIMIKNQFFIIIILFVILARTDFINSLSFWFFNIFFF